MVDIETISIVIAIVSLSIATIYSALTLRNRNRALQAQLYTEIFDKFNTNEFIDSWIEVMYHQNRKAPEEWWDKYGPIANREAAIKLFSVGILYQTIGMLARERLINPALVFRENPWAAVETWERLEPVVKLIRKEDPKFWDSFKYLADQIKKRRQ